MLTVHHAQAGRSVRVIWLCEELGLEYEVRTVEFKPEVLQSPTYLALHPLGQIPVLRDGGITVYESGAILEYLLEQYGAGRLAPDRSAKRQRAEYLQWFHFGEATLARRSSIITRNRFRMPKTDRVPEVLPQARRDYVAALELVETTLAARPFICGDVFTAADIMVSYGITVGKLVGELPRDLPHVHGYLARLKERSGYRCAWAS